MSEKEKAFKELDALDTKIAGNKTELQKAFDERYHVRCKVDSSHVYSNEVDFCPRCRFPKHQNL